MFRPFKSRIIFKSIVLLSLAVSSLSFASNTEMHKLSEYKATELVTNIASSMSSASVIFRGQPYVVKLVKSPSDDIKLLTLSFVNSYSELSTNELKMGKLLASDGDYQIVLGANTEAMYLLITSSENNYRGNKNLLLKSTDGISWKLSKSFPAEWVLDDLEVHGSNLSVTCYNCEDEAKPAYIISNNNGATWHEYGLPESAGEWQFSGVSNNKLFAIATVRDTNDRAKLIPVLHSNDLTTRHNTWVKSDISHLLETTAVYQNTTLKFTFSEVNKIFDAGDALIALTEYESLIDGSKGVYASKHFAWFSNDNGLTWSFINVDLNDEVITQVNKTANKYNIVTAKALSLELEEDEEGNTDGKASYNDLLAFFKQQKYSFYQFTTEDFIHTEMVKLAPRYEILNAMGFNLDYQSSAKGSYADAVVVHNVDDELMIEFYRMDA